MKTFYPLLVCAVHALSSPAWGSAAEPTPSKVQEVIVVFKTHFDIGYTAMASEVVERYRTKMIDQALEVVDQNRSLPPEQQFAWTLPGWPMSKILEDWPGQTAQRKDRVQQAFRDGRFVVHALPFTTHTELLEAEDLVRGLGYSSRIARAGDKPLARDAKMTDVPSHSWIMPTLLKHAGVEFLHLGCNAASRSPQVPRLFWWEGPDGSRVLTMYTAESYGTDLVAPKDWPYRTWLALIHTGDNHGPPTPAEVRTILDRAQRDLPGVRVRIGRLSDFSDAILAEKAEIPVVRGDMPDTWIHGPMADPRGAAMARAVRPRLAAAEQLATQLGVWGIHPSKSAVGLASAWENSLLYGEHTWGGAFWWIYGKYVLKFGDDWKADRAAGKFQRIEASWDEHTAYIERAAALTATALTNSLLDLAEAVKVRGPRVVVFNPLPWERDGLVTVSLSDKGATLTDLATRDRVDSTVIGDRVQFLARKVPGGGYRTFVIGPPAKAQPAKAAPASPVNILENRFFKLTLDPARGTVSSWLDKRSGRELVDATAPQGFGQHLYERFDRDQVQAFVKAYVKITADWGINELGKPSQPPATEAPYRAASPRGFKVQIEKSGLGTAATLSATPNDGLPHGVATRIMLYDDLPVVDLEITLTDKPFDPWPEAGWLCLPFNVEAPSFRLARLGSIVDPAKDFVAGCNFDQIALNGGLTVTGRDGRGVGLCALDSPLVSLGEPGGWKYTRTWTPRPGRVFVNLFNNQWSTNFRLWNAGTWTSRVRLWPVAGDDAEKNLVTPSEEGRVPLLAAVADGPGGALPPTRAGLQLSRKGVKVTAFGPNPDGEGLILRLWDQAGKADTVKVTLPQGLDLKQVIPVDLRGRPVAKPIPVKSGRFEASLGAYAPASFVLERQ